MSSIFLLLAFFLVSSSSIEITLDSDGRYQNLAIVIGDQVDESQQLLDNLQAAITEASTAMIYLSKRSERKARGFSFGDVKIVVPESWKLAAAFQRAGTDLLENAVIRVEPMNKAYGTAPYTIQPGNCGEPGKYVHLAPEFLLSLEESRKLYGDLGKKLVHEWAHVRWGVFDEYNNLGPHFYIDNGKLVPVRCVESLGGRIANKNTKNDCIIDVEKLEVEPDCRFYPEDGGVAKGSAMFAHYLKAVTSFCDNTTDASVKHNSYAPNPHNRLCGKQSVWDVLMKHKDFKVNVPSEALRNTTFTFLKSETQRDISLVLDVSGSMGSPKNGLIPMDKLKIAVMKLLLNDVESTARVGIVTFSNVVNEYKPLQLMSTDKIRDEFTDAIILLNPNGGTAVGDGLIGGMKQLDPSFDPQNPTKFKGNGVIILLTDGEENDGRIKIPQAIDIAAQTSVIVNVISFGRLADQKLPGLAQRTGGRHFFSDDDKRGVELMDALAAMVQGGAPPKAKPIDIISGNIAYIKDKVTNKNFMVDQSANNNVFLTFSYDKLSPVDLELTDPNGKKYTKLDSPKIYRVNLNLATININIAGQSPEGKWTLSILPRTNRRRRSTQFSEADAQLSISGRSGNNSIPILLSGSSSTNLIDTLSGKTEVRMFADLMQGNDPIIGAEVYAHVGFADPVRMFDNGVGPDNFKDDGVYSSFAPLNGLYNQGKAGDVAVRFSCVTPVSRTVAASAIRIKSLGNYNPNSDTIPPASVTDLRATPNLRNRTIILNWTSVGDNGYQGNVSYYKVRVSTVAEIVGNQFNSSEINMIIEPPFNQQSLLLTEAIVDATAGVSNSKTFYFQVRGVDATGNEAMEYSNLASTMLTEPSNLADFKPLVITRPPIITPSPPRSGLAGGVVAAIVIVIGVTFIIVIVGGVILIKKKNGSARIA